MSRTASHFLHIALLLLVVAGAGNMHSHLCLDGQDVPVTVHFENLGSHPLHHDLAHGHEADHDESAADLAHIDVENELITRVLPGKAPDQDNPLFLAALALFCCLRLPPRQDYLVPRDAALPPPPSSLLPSPRAPPAHSS